MSERHSPRDPGRGDLALASSSEAAEAPVTGMVGVGPSSEPGASSPHASRFRTAFGVLAGLGVAAVVLAAALLARPGDSGPGPSWSSWQPRSEGTAAAREIADHFAPLYRISGTDQLAIVTVASVGSGTASASRSSSSPAGGNLQIAVRPDAGSSSISLLNGHTVAFNLCGVGSDDCSIGVGKPSTDRLLLLRREALELALYTFKYVGAAQNVVALLPPGHSVQRSTLTATPPKSSQSSASTPVHLAVLFVRDELKPFLAQPISATLPLTYPPTVDQVKIWKATQEAALVEQVTARGMFNQAITQAQDGSSLMVLSPLPPS